MPSKLRVPRSSREDLRALKRFLRERQKNWPAVATSFRMLELSYSEYSKAFWRMPVLSKKASAARQASALNGLYEQKPKCLDYIGELRKRANERLACCPYCGIPGTLTLDHYLPREVGSFPHLSILSANLVPACIACQQYKGSFVPAQRRGRRAEVPAKRRTKIIKTSSLVRQSLSASKTNFFCDFAWRRRLLHPYFDEFLHSVVLRASPKSQTERLASLLVVPALQNWTRMSIVSAHVARLRIAERSVGPVRRLTTYVIESARRRGVSTPEGLVQELESLVHAAVARDRTVNSIDAVGARGMLADAHLREELLARISAAPPSLTVVGRAIVF